LQFCHDGRISGKSRANLWTGGFWQDRAVLKISPTKWEVGHAFQVACGRCRSCGCHRHRACVGGGPAGQGSAASGGHAVVGQRLSRALGGWDRSKFTNSSDSDENETNDGWLVGGAGRVNLWINPSFSVQFDAQGEGTQFKVQNCSGGVGCNYTNHGYLVAGHATWRDPQRGGVGVFGAVGDMTVPSAFGISALSNNASVRFALGGAEAFMNWNQFTFYLQGGYGATVGDNLSIFGWSVTAPFVRGTVRYYPTPNWLLEGTVLGAWATLSSNGSTVGPFDDQSIGVVLWRVKAETMVHPNLSLYAAYQGSRTELSCNSTFPCPGPTGTKLQGQDDRVIGGVRIWLNRDNLRNNDLTGAPLDVINPLGVAFVGGVERFEVEQ
jgi:hypothetical protein